MTNTKTARTGKPADRGEYVVVRVVETGFGIVRVTRGDDGEIAAVVIHRCDDRQKAFRCARDIAGLSNTPLMGRDGLEVVPVSEVRF